MTASDKSDYRRQLYTERNEVAKQTRRRALR
jgi:hypothetical protein